MGRLGEPDEETDALLRYRYPPGCAYEVEILTLYLVGGRVRRMEGRREITGQHCMDADGNMY